MPEDDSRSDEPPTGDGTTAGDHRTGPLAGEARKLLSAVQEWAQRNLPEPPSGHGGPECQWCPLCQFASVLRGECPEVTERMAEAGTALAQALHGFLETAAKRTGAAKDGTRTAQRSSSRPRPAPRVQHITLDDEPA